MKTIGGIGVGGQHRPSRNSRRSWVMMVLVVATIAGSLELGLRPSSAQTPPSSPASFPSVDATAANAGKEPPSSDVPTPDEAVAGQPPVLAQAKPGEELVDRRTASSKTFAGDQPGQLRTELYDGPVHFKDAQGRWADIDETLVAAKDGRRHAAANAFDLSLASSSTDAAVARLAIDDKHSVGFSLDGAAKVTAKADAKSVTYPRVRKDTDVRLSSQTSGLKEELILASRAAPDRFVFPLVLTGLTASINETGDVIYRDESGVERARTPHGFMTDSNVDPRSGEAPLSLGVTYALIPWGNSTALEVRLDRAWLDDPARRWPVVVDPEIHNAAWGDDTYVMSNFSRDNSWDAELKVGTYDGGLPNGHVGRSYMHFDTGALAGASVQRAELHAAERHSWNCGYWPEPVYRVTQGWDGRTMRDFPGAAVDPNWVGGTWEGTTCGARTAKWDVTGMAGYWASVGEQQGSLSLRATNESDNNMYKKYASTEAGAPPALHVWYTPPNRPPAVPYGITPAHGTILGTPTTSVSAIYADPDGGSGQLAFGVWNYQNQLVWSQWSGALCSGCRATLNVPALPDNWYYVMVIGHDGAQYSSAWSSPQWFFIDTLAPSASELTPANGASGAAPAHVSARYSEPYGFSGYMYFWLYTTSGTKIVENWSGLTASGSVATLAIPSLAAGTYNLWAAPWDTRQLGAQIGPNTFTVGSTSTTTSSSTTTTTVAPTTSTTVAPTTTTTSSTTTTTPAPTTTTSTTTSTTTTSTTVPPPPPQPIYFALGDSYSAGDGVPPYYQEPCRRSERVYGSLYATTHASPEPLLAHFACSGKIIEEMVADQYPFVVSNTDLVTLTIGGNNLGFSSVLTECIASPFDCRDDQKEDDARALYTPLKDAYSSLKQLAPVARIVVLTYPLIFTNENRVSGLECIGDLGMSPEERTWVNSVTTALNDTIRSAGQDAGVEVLSIEDAFRGHEVCTQSPFFHGYEGVGDARSFHPNLTGNEVMATRLAAHLQPPTP
ncbi:MAG: GDSL-type esterase/lipase family protein [Acidimicrobiales bacterium]